MIHPVVSFECGNGACPDFNSNSQKYAILGLLFQIDDSSSRFF